MAKNFFKCEISEKERLGESSAQSSSMSDGKFEVTKQCVPQSPWQMSVNEKNWDRNKAS